MLVLAAWLSLAQAQDPSPPSREPLPALAVERVPVLPRGWWEAELGHRWHRATALFGEDGRRLPIDPDLWRIRTTHLSLRHGLASDLELRADVPLVFVRRSAGGRTRSRTQLGDPGFGVRWQPWSRLWPPAGLALGLDQRVPAARQPAAAVGEVTDVDALVVSPGTPVTTLSAEMRQGGGPIAVWSRGHVAVGWPSVVRMRIGHTRAEPASHFDPGERIGAEVGALLQGGPLVLRSAVEVEARTVSRAAPSGERLQPLYGSEGVTVAVRGSVELHVSRGVELALGVGAPVVAEDAGLFPIEALHPTAGPTGSLDLRVRF